MQLFGRIFLKKRPTNVLCKKKDLSKVKRENKIKSLVFFFFKEGISHKRCPRSKHTWLKKLIMKKTCL